MIRLSARVQVPLPLLVAVRVCPPTTMLMAAVLSLTVPVRGGRRSLVESELTVIVGPVVSILNSPTVASDPALPATSVAVTATS